MTFVFGHSMMSILSLLYLVLLTIANLPRKTESCQHCHTNKEALTKQAYASEGGSSGIVNALTGLFYASEDGSDEVDYSALHASLPGKPYDEYYGCVATIDVYGHNISHGQLSASSIYVANIGDRSKGSFNSITAGWMVSPDLYGDSLTHFYIHWTKDGYGQSGCYNLDCPGFQLEHGSKITPGTIINSASTVGGSGHTITIKLFKEKSSGNWWVYYGINDDTPTSVGYYPANLFTTLAAKANAIAFGGEIIAKRSLPTPPMGSGLLPSENAASFSNIQFVDQNGQATLIQSDLPVIAKSPKCYYASPIIGAKFFYGGPAGCF